MSSSERMVSGHRQSLGETMVETLGVVSQGRRFSMENLAGLVDITSVHI